MTTTTTYAFEVCRLGRSSFEEWADRGRRFNVLVAASSWHWIDPERAVGAPLGRSDRSLFVVKRRFAGASKHASARQGQGVHRGMWQWLVASSDSGSAHDVIVPDFAGDVVDTTSSCPVSCEAPISIAVVRSRSVDQRSRSVLGIGTHARPRPGGWGQSAADRGQRRNDVLHPSASHVTLAAAHSAPNLPAMPTASPPMAPPTTPIGTVPAIAVPPVAIPVPAP